MTRALHRTNGYGGIAAGAVLALLAASPATAQPSWSVSGGAFTHRMDLHVAVYDANRRVGGRGDLLAAFVGEQVRGVAPAILTAEGVRFALTAFTNRTSDTLTFRWYDAAADLVVGLENRVPFVAGGAVAGSAARPRRLYVKGSGALLFDADAWTFNPAEHRASMQVTAAVVVGAREAANSLDRLAAFVDGKVRGVASPLVVRGRYVFFLTVYGAPGDGAVSFSFFDAPTGTVARVQETFGFADDAGVGTAAAPVLLHTVAAPSVTLASLRVFLQGPYGNGAMSAALAAADLLPLAHPYGGVPFGHAGAEAVPAAFLAAHPDLADWLLVRLRKTSDPADVVASVAAFVKADGTVIGAAGGAGVAFPNTPAGRYYVSVHHRNHLSAMTATALDCASGTCAFDFATGATYGADGQAPLGGGVAGLWAGDADGNGRVDATDYQHFWRLLNGGPEGYRAADFDLDGYVIATDYQGYWRVNNSRESRVPEN